MYKKIKTILKTIITNKDKVEYAQFLKIKDLWEKKINQKTKKGVCLIDYKDKTITIKAKNPTWKNETIFMKEEIKKNSQHPTHQLKK